MCIKKIVLSILVLNIFVANLCVLMAAEHALPSTPVRAKRPRLSEDYDFEYKTPESAKIRARVSKNSLCDGSVQAWPSLWEEHEWSADFIKNLARASRIQDGKTMLHLAMISSPLSENKIECIRNLILAGEADIYARDNDGNNPIYAWVARSINFRGSAVHPREVETVGAILREMNERMPINFDALRSYVSNNTPMHLVCSTGLENVDLFSLFIDLGYDLRLLGSQNRTILHCLAQACPCDQNDAIVDRLTYLLENDANIRAGLREIVNMRDWFGCTALHYVCIGWTRKGNRAYLLNFRLFNLLMSDLIECDVNVADNYDNTPLFYIRKRCSTRVGGVARRMRDKLYEKGAR